MKTTTRDQVNTLLANGVKGKYIADLANCDKSHLLRYAAGNGVSPEMEYQIKKAILQFRANIDSIFVDEY